MDGLKRKFPLQLLQSFTCVVLLVLCIYYFKYLSRPNDTLLYNRHSDVQNLSYYHYIKVQDKKHDSKHFFRIVHISDTHGIHNDLLNKGPKIPDGDILIHSGDFSEYKVSRKQGLVEYLLPLEEFFQALPHKYKIYLPGNHDYPLVNLTSDHVQKFLKSAIYLQDKSLIIEGIRFYGTGWNRARKISKAQAFAVEADKIQTYWDKIPTDTEVLVTHSPPFAILDQDVEGNLPAVMPCTPEVHCEHLHMGCMKLREIVTAKIRYKISKVVYYIAFYVTREMFEEDL